MKSLVTIVVLGWLVIGALAAWQRGYFGNDQDVSCAGLGNTALTIVAGPANYLGANPKVSCELPQPSQ